MRRVRQAVFTAGPNCKCFIPLFVFPFSMNQSNLFSLELSTFLMFFSCERHARAAASDFAKACVHYINTNLPGNVQVTASHSEFMKRFVDCFSEHFETEFSRRRLSQQKPSNGTVPSSIEEESDYAVDHGDVPKPTKPFFRRLSFKGLKKGKVRWHPWINRLPGFNSWTIQSILI